MHPSPFTNTNTINPASNYIYTIGTGTKMLAHGRKISTFSVWDKNFPLHVLLHESGLSDVKAGEMVDDIRDAIRDKQGDKERLLGDTEKQKFITEWCDNMRKKYFRTKQDSILSGDNREVNHLLEMIINRKISHMYAPVRRALGVSPKRGSYRRNNASGTTRVSALRNEIEPNVGEEVNSTRGANLRRRGTLRKMDTGRPFKKVKLEGESPATTRNDRKRTVASASNAAPQSENSTTPNKATQSPPVKAYVEPIQRVMIKSVLQRPPTGLQEPEKTAATDEAEGEFSFDEEPLPCPLRFLWAAGVPTMLGLLQRIVKAWRVKYEDIQRVEVKVPGTREFIELALDNIHSDLEPSVDLVENLSRRPGGVWEGEVLVTVDGNGYSDMIDEFRTRKSQEDRASNEVAYEEEGGGTTSEEE